MKPGTLCCAGLACMLMMPAPLAAEDCANADPFACIANHAKAEMDRLSLTASEDQAASFRAISALAIIEKNGPEAAARSWEEGGLPVYDLVLSLLLAKREPEARAAARAAKKPFVYDADSKHLSGEAGFRQMQEDLSAFYLGEQAMAYARACVSDEAFRTEIGGSAEMRLGACRVPYDKRMVQRAFGLMQLMKDVSRDEAVEGALQYAYRVPSCAVAEAIIDIAHDSRALGGDGETAAWKVLDMATICAAELLQEKSL